MSTGWSGCCGPFGALRHTKGRWAAVRSRCRRGRSSTWWRRRSGGWPRTRTLDGLEVRVVRTAWWEVPRKAGKSALASGAATVLLTADSEPGAEVYSAATGKDQARIVFNEAKAMMVAAPALARKVKPLADLVRVPATNSFFRVLSKVADGAHGLNVSGAVVDEVHVHKSRELIDVITTGTGARSQPLVILITTADDGDESTIYAEHHNDVVTLAEGTADPDPSLYGVVFAASESDDPFDEDTWARANPGLGVTVTKRYLREKADRARRLPSFLPTFQRLHLNVRMRDKGRWLPLPAWDACGGLVDADALAGRPCFGGLDIGSTDDLCAWVLLFPDRLVWLDDAGDERLAVDGWRILARTWITSAGLARRERMAPALHRWIDLGWLTELPGDNIDIATVEAQILVFLLRSFVSVFLSQLARPPGRMHPTSFSHGSIALMPCEWMIGSSRWP